MAKNEALNIALKVGLGVVVAKALLAPDRSWGEFLGTLVSKPLSNDVNLRNSIRRGLTEYNAMHDGTRVPQSSCNSFTHIDIESIFEEAFKKTFGRPVPSDSVSTPPKPAQDPQTIEAGRWLRLVKHPSIVLILGKRGSGKSALGYRLLELSRYVATPYVVGLPAEARKLLPDWIGMAASLEDAPPKAIVLVDEAFMPYHARSSMAAEAKAMSQLLNLSRQREQTIIFVSQQAREVDRNIASSANVVVFKDLGTLQLAFDRPELKVFASQARQALAAVGNHKERFAFVCSLDADHAGLVENSLPSFWRERLSHIFATGGEAITRAPEKPRLNQRIAKAKELRQQRLSLGRIAKQMRVSKGTIKNWLNDYPYRHKPGQQV